MSTQVITESATSPNPNGPLELHMIGNAHMDPVWVWDWREGFGEVWSTFKSALERIDEHASVTFTASSAAYYSWIELHDPEMFKQIQAAVTSGRWHFVGGMWIEPDCNIPSGESLCRQLLHGQRYFRRVFGSVTSTGYNIDSFGHSAGMPSLLLGAGLDAYVFMRPGAHERDLPTNAFRWSDPSGNVITTFRIPGNYETDSLDALCQNIAAASQLSQEQGTPEMCFFGIGNHGGGPTRSMMALIDEVHATRPEVHYSDPAQYFNELRLSPLALPTVEGELQHHARGCYSVSAWAKRANRSGESALLDAETLDAIACSVARRSGSESELAHAWEELLLCQFHDVLAGTSSTSAYRTIQCRYGFVETVADRITTNALYQIAHCVDTRIETIGAQERESLWTTNDNAAAPFVVFNPLAWPVRHTVTVARSASRVLDSAGSEIPSQAVTSGELTVYPSHMLFSIELGPLGYEVVWLQGSRIRYPDDVAAASPEIVTDRFRVTTDVETGAITSIFDVRSSTELVASPGIAPLVFVDESDTWSHGLARYGGDVIDLQFDGWEVVENGPLRWILRLRFHSGESRLLEDVVIAEGAEFVEIRIRADWSTPRTVVKLNFPWNIGPESVTVAGAAYSFQERAPSGDEEVMQGWLDYYDSTLDSGIALTTDHLYGYDASDGVVRVTLLRNPIAADHGGTWARRVGEDFTLTDSGHHEASIRVHPHRGDWRQLNLSARSDEHHRKAIVVAETYHGGTLPGRGSFLGTNPPSRGVVRVVKRAEDGTGVVVRLVEPVGRAATLHLDGAAFGRSVTIDLEPFEIRTVLVPDDATQAPRMVNIVEIDVVDKGVVG